MWQETLFLATVSVWTALTQHFPEKWYFKANHIYCIPKNMQTYIYDRMPESVYFSAKQRENAFLFGDNHNCYQQPSGVRERVSL